MAASSAAVTEKLERRPVTYVATLWWAYLLCAMYLLYGGVKVILSFLDHTYTDLSTPLAFLIMGLAVAVVVIAYRDRKSWGWYALVILNILVVLLAVLIRPERQVNQNELTFLWNVVLLVLGISALAALFTPATKSYIFGHR